LYVQEEDVNVVVAQHFQGGQAVVDHVVGEFYWAVARGDTTESNDYVSPPFMLSSEKDESEINWSHGTYKAPREIWEAFSLPGEAPAPQGIAPHQPSPYAGRVARVWAAGRAPNGLEIGAISDPLPGETECGDGWDVRSTASILPTRFVN